MNPIQDAFSALPISRQRKWQLRQESKGLCVTCGQPALSNLRRCEKHHRQVQAKRRKLFGVKRFSKNTKFNRALAERKV